MGGEPIPAPGGDAVPAPLHVDVFATILHRQAGEARQLLTFLADRLARALPEAVTVAHHGLLGVGSIKSVRIQLPGRELELRRGPAGTLLATSGQAVHGVVLRHDEIPLDDWLDQLAASLADVAANSESSRYALRSIVS